MKRLYIFITAILFAAVTVSAQQISREVAAQKATAFVDKANPQVKQLLTLAYKADKPATALAPKDDAYLYVFNRGFNQGFVIVSGDERTNDILGYCDHGSFDPNNLPTNFKYFLDEYARQIQYMQEHNLQPAKAIARAEKQNIGYLIKTQWDQGSPYNYYLGNCVTGCVATAMAQVMYYWRWPEGETATIPAYSGAGLLSGESLPPTTFNWSKMKLKYYSGDYSDDYEVGKLMKYAGHAVKMDYNTAASGGSGAQASDIISALNRYFGYPDDEQFLSRVNFMSAAKWADTIYANIADQIPVIMAGGGHCYICDGYKDGKFHINWGWGGDSDGYFDLEVLDPENSGIGGSSGGYASNCRAITRIHNPSKIVPEIPKDEIPLTAESIRMYAGTQTLSRDSRTEYVSGDLRYYIPVLSDITDNEQVDTLLTGMGYYDSEDNLIGVYGARYKLFTSQGGYYYSDLGSFGGEYPYGTYKLYPVWGDIDAGQWKKINSADTKYIQVDVLEDGKSVKFTPSRQLDVVVNETNPSSNTYYQTMVVTNNGTEAFTGVVYVYCIYGNGDNDSKFNEVKIENLAPGASKEVNVTSYIGNATSTTRYSMNNFIVFVLNSMSLSDGLWDNYGNFIGLVDFYTEAPWTSVLHVGNNLKFTVEMENDCYDSFTQNMKVTLFPKNGTVASGKSQTKSITIGKYSVATAEFEFPNLTYNKQYDIEIFCGEGTDTITCDTISAYGYGITPVKGAVVYGNEASYLLLDDSVATWKEIPADAYCVDARYTDKASSLVPGANPNTLYLLAEGSAVPTKLEGKNVVVGTNCAELNVDDAYEFYSIIDFTAQKANYRRTFANGNDGTTANWETLLLPFDVTSVTKDDGATPLSWFTSKSEHGKNFWVYRFASEDNDNTVVFETPESSSMLAGNTPYIITVPAQSQKWTSKWVLTGKELTFSGENVSIPATNKGVTTFGAGKKFDFIGRTYGGERNQIYSLNQKGTRFEYTQTSWAQIDPYRCYFVGYFNNEALTVKMRFGDNESTGIEETMADNDEPTAVAPTVYTLDGKAVGTDVKQLPVGTYVTKGKKFMVNKFIPSFPRLK